MHDAYTSLSHQERITLQFTETYHLAYLIDDMIKEGSFYISAEFSDYHSENGHLYAKPFNTWTALHRFVAFVAFLTIDNDFSRASHGEYIRVNRCNGPWCHASKPYLLAEELLRVHGVGTGEITTELEGWVRSDCPYCPAALDTEQPNWDQLWEDILLVEGIEAALEDLTEEVFYVLFPNRTFLYNFNKFMAGWLQSIDSDNPHLRRDNKETLALRRVVTPEWAKRAVFFRDRGMCCQCGLLLGQTYSNVDRRAFDHMVPLANGGLNDVTNLQLLCKSCNSSKSSHSTEPGSIYQRWFKVRRPT